MVSYLSHPTVDAHDAYAQSVWGSQVLGHAEDPDGRSRVVRADPGGHEDCILRGVVEMG